MAKPLYDRATAKSRPMETPRPLKRRRIGAANRRRLGIAAAGSAALLVTGVVALAIWPKDGAGSVSASLNTNSRGAEAARRIQVAKASAETPRRAEHIASGTPPTAEQAPASPALAQAEVLRPERAPAIPASDPATPLASDEPPVGSGAPEPSVPSQPPRSLVATSAAAPLDCVRAELRTVLADVAARFGPVNVVSTNRLNADNHTPGTARHNLHTACKAVDFKTGGNVREVLTYLRSRPEVSGINSYRGGLIHIDLNERSRAAGLRPRAQPVANE